MPRSLPLYLWDIELAARDLTAFTQNKSFIEFENDRLTQAAVERKFEIIGEALVQMRDHYLDHFSLLPETGPFIAFRNILIHRYSGIDDLLVWEAISSESLLRLREKIAELLQIVKA